VAEQSTHMADCFEWISNNYAKGVSKIVDEKLKVHQTQVITSVQQMLGNFLANVRGLIRDQND
jgi:hypothetical protein